MIKDINNTFHIFSSENASEEDDIRRLRNYSPIPIPDEYIDLIREKADILIGIAENKSVLLWSARRCVEINQANNIQSYLPNSLAIADDGDGNALVYSDGRDGFGLYAVAFNDLDKDEMIFISKSLENLLVYAIGADTLMKI
jgi:hypothetical protein